MKTNYAFSTADENNFLSSTFSLISLYLFESLSVEILGRQIVPVFHLD